MRKFLVALILAGVMVFGGNQWAQAAHTSFGFTLPHEVAEFIAQWHFDAIDTTLYEKVGCDIVATAAIRTDDRAVAGYVIHAADPKAKTERLVSVELWDIRGKKLFSWQNKADYKSLKACHAGTSI